MPGWLLIAICITCWGSWALFEKMALKTLSPCTAQISGAILFMIWSVGLIFFAKANHEPIKITTQGTIFLILATLCSFIANTAYLYALKKMDTNYVTGLTSSYPIFTLILCALIFREQITMLNALGMIAIVIGTIMVSL